LFGGQFLGFLLQLGTVGVAEGGGVGRPAPNQAGQPLLIVAGSRVQVNLQQAEHFNFEQLKRGATLRPLAVLVCFRVGWRRLLLRFVNGLRERVHHSFQAREGVPLGLLRVGACVASVEQRGGGEQSAVRFLQAQPHRGQSVEDFAMVLRHLGKLAFFFRQLGHALDVRLRKGRVGGACVVKAGRLFENFFLPLDHLGKFRLQAADEHEGKIFFGPLAAFGQLLGRGGQILLGLLYIIAGLRRLLLLGGRIIVSVLVGKMVRRALSALTGIGRLQAIELPGELADFVVQILLLFSERGLALLIGGIRGLLFGIR
jgi:hypothetical protein